MDLKTVIRDVPDFPKPGILFRDITPVLNHPAAFAAAVDGMAGLVADLAFDRLAAMESRGFLFGAPLGLRLDKGLVMLRKPGKLPTDVVAESYALEYGEASLEVHRDAVRPGERVLIVDDLLATGGTAAAAGRLIRRLGGEVAGYLFLVSLEDLGGAVLLADAPVFSLVKYA
jgi:adenine phosphoribosyltransferase